MVSPSDLRTAFEELRTRLGTLPTSSADYRLLSRGGPCLPAISREGAPSVVILLCEAPGTIARVSSGVLLRPGHAVTFDLDGRVWTGPAAVLECRSLELMDTFVVLAADLANRISTPGSDPTWKDVATIVDEWQRLLSRTGRLAPDAELGLWCELTFIDSSATPDRIAAGWIGPDARHVDFLLDGVGAEVKGSTTRLAHHVSLSQAETPIGDLESFFVSMWVEHDPEGGSSLGELAKSLMNRLRDSSHFLMQLLKAGYAPTDQAAYGTRFRLLETPSWFNATDIPSVHSFDPGISDIRYRVHLDRALSVPTETAERLRQHFACGTRGIQE